MSIQDKITNQEITFDPNFSPAQRQKLIAALENLYGVDGDVNLAGSSRAREILDEFTTSAPLHFDYVPGKAEAFGGSNVVRIDPDQSWLIINGSGAVVDAGLDRIVMHEIIHAHLGFRDPHNGLSAFIPYDPIDYQGATVAENNIIMSQLNRDERLSYSNADQSGGVDFLSISDPNWTFGATVTNINITYPLETVPIYNTSTIGLNPQFFLNTTGIHDLIIDAANMDNKIESGQGNDFVYAMAGNDYIRGGQGNDYLHGGTGDDTASYFVNLFDAGPSQTTGIRLQAHSDSITVRDGYGTIDTLVNIEHVVGSAFDDNFELSGSLLVTSFTLNSLNGDALDFNGILASSQEVNGDTVVANLDSAVTIDLNQNSGFIQSNDLGATISLRGFENAIGSDFDDTILGDDSENDIKGGDGNDTLEGGAGNDVLDGGLDDDTLYGGDDDDRLHGRNGDDILYGGDGRDTLYGNFGDDLIYGGDKTDAVRGSKGNDTIYGEGGNDNLFGDEGNDTIYGGTGNDKLAGGAGADVFVFSEGDGADFIRDFNVYEDFIDLSGIVVPDLSYEEYIFQVGNKVVIDFGGGDVLTLANMTLEELGLVTIPLPPITPTDPPENMV